MEVGILQANRVSCTLSAERITDMTETEMLTPTEAALAAGSDVSVSAASSGASSSQVNLSVRAWRFGRHDVRHVTVNDSKQYAYTQPQSLTHPRFEVSSLHLGAEGWRIIVGRHSWWITPSRAAAPQSELEATAVEASSALTLVDDQGFEVAPPSGAAAEEHSAPEYDEPRLRGFTFGRLLAFYKPTAHPDGFGRMEENVKLRNVVEVATIHQGGRLVGVRAIFGSKSFWVIR